jgi:hypothetical protein
LPDRIPEHQKWENPLLSKVFQIWSEHWNSWVQLYGRGSQGVSGICRGLETKCYIMYHSSCYKRVLTMNVGPAKFYFFIEMLARQSFLAFLTVRHSSWNQFYTSLCIYGPMATKIIKNPLRVSHNLIKWPLNLFHNFIKYYTWHNPSDVLNFTYVAKIRFIKCFSSLEFDLNSIPHF